MNHLLGHGPWSFTVAINELLCMKNAGAQIWISAKMNVWHSWQLKPVKKSKSWGTFWSYQLNSTANSAHWAQFLRYLNGLNWQCYLAGSSKTAPRILIFSIAIGADYSYEMKNSKI